MEFIVLSSCLLSTQQYLDRFKEWKKQDSIEVFVIGEPVVNHID